MKKLFIILSLTILAGCSTRIPQTQATPEQLHQALQDIQEINKPLTPDAMCVDHVWYLIFENGVTPRYGVNGIITTC